MIRDVLIEQRRELEEILAERYVKRTVPAHALQASPLVKVVIGPRRAGKSFFAAHLAQSLGPFGYVNFDDERLAGELDAGSLLTSVDEFYGHPKHLLLDEIQNLPSWELLVNRLQRHRRRLVITGSNSNLLSSELSTHLTGRHQTIVIFPFSLCELIRLQGNELTQAERQSLLDRYVREGGMPEPWVTAINRVEYLRTLVHSILYKDIISRFRIRAIQGLEDLAHYLFSNVAKEFSYRRLAQVTRCRSPHTAEKYLRHLEEAFLFFTLPRFSFKAREQASANKKVYCVDNGTATALGFRAGRDQGQLLENTVAIALRRRELYGDFSIFFWRNAANQEVDFVVRQGLQVTELIQVCRDVSDPKTLDLETRALLRAGAELDCNRLTILTVGEAKEYEAQWHTIKGTIRHVPLAEWLTAHA